LDWLIKTAFALWKLHKNNILHLDLKPENVMMINEFQPRIIDLGNSMTQEKAKNINFFIGSEKFVQKENFENGNYVYDF